MVGGVGERGFEGNIEFEFRWPPPLGLLPAVRFSSIDSENRLLLRSICLARDVRCKRFQFQFMSRDNNKNIKIILLLFFMSPICSLRWQTLKIVLKQTFFFLIFLNVHNCHGHLCPLRTHGVLVPRVKNN